MPGPATPDDPVTVVRGPDALARRFVRAQRAARDEVLILRPPNVDHPRIRYEQLARGVAYRTIYDESSLDSAEKLAEARDLAARGEQCRVLGDVPLGLLVTDRRLGLVPAGDEVFVLHPSALLDGLVTLFETLWQRATPLWTRGRRRRPAGLTEQDEQLLALSAAGLTDETIARRLGVAQRTVERRMRRVMDRLHARTRFQAGMQAARLGILGGPDT